ncbi:LOW QUALITY PROTEIN: olfactory receptor 8K3-like [Dromiciops gliroides]|uniref:LOW QUALITY PROTEIN: olfactory receptor 8K3-like n=1 Tax=Dromiciops gliroides TaxID=33562 RepID=UPI001CC3FB11|nr:LOW QUALITY PROTEIN: olfactory receptor 8K3-like [Dromiciops gliroides]
MIKLNETTEREVTEFILMGLTNHPELQAPLFVLFFINIYMAIALGNLGLIMLTTVDSHLQTPMYFFLRHLAFVDLGYSTTIGPKMLVSFIEEKNIISYNGCAIQLVFYVLFITNELIILSAMAYDRYVTICNPLHYMFIMSDRVCWIFVSISYLYSIMVSLLLTIKIFKSSFCNSNIIKHFYCDGLPLLSIACSDTSEIELIIVVFALLNFLSSLLIILVSYILILAAFLRMNSSEGRQKAFSTCGSHLTMVVVFYGTLLFMYLQPQSGHSFDTDKIASVLHTLIIPMLNPLIYSLRNKEVKGALKSLFKNGCKHSL